MTLDLDSLLADFDKRSWPEMLSALVDGGFVTPEESAAFQASAAQRGMEFAVLADTTLHDQALDSVAKAEASGVPFADFDPESIAAPLAESDAPMVGAIAHGDLQVPFNEAHRNSERAGGDEFFRFTAVLDNRTTDICRSLDGTMLAVDDPFWKAHSPPLHDRCRSSLVGYTGRMASKIGITSRPEEGQYVPPNKGWGADEFRYDTVLAGKDHALEAVARAKINNPLW